MARKFNKTNEESTKDAKAKYPKHSKGKSRNKSKEKDTSAALSSEGRDNNPNWYFLDAKVAEQVSQISFQELAGVSPNFEGIDIPLGNIYAIGLNPAPGVQKAAENSAINLAGFRIYSKLSAYTGRNATYGPQDVSTMILIFGEIISKFESLRRVFGISNQYSMRNRAYPKAVIRAMNIDEDDFFSNYADYRLRFNKLITMVNQIPIPQNVAYFDKCASLYEKVYLDAPSSMAQTLFFIPWTSWKLDETTYSGGTVLKTEDWYGVAGTFNTRLSLKTFKNYLDYLEADVNDLLTSSTFHVIYTDLLNLAMKLNVGFWKFDYIDEDYIVTPEYNENFLLQMHNMTFMNAPHVNGGITQLNLGYTPNNDVYPDPTKNVLIYNPMFRTDSNTDYGVCCVPSEHILDMLTDMPTVEDKIEITRFVSLPSKGRVIPPSGTTHIGIVDNALPDHYGVIMIMFCTDGNESKVGNILNPNAPATDLQVLSRLSGVNWAPRMYLATSALTAWDAYNFGDLNFYTIINNTWLGRIHDFVGLGLYDLR